LLELPYADFTRADLDGSRLVGIVLAPEPDLALASLKHVQAMDGDFSEANFVRADLTYADLAYAKLCFANLAGAKLTGANLTGAKLSGARFFSNVEQKEEGAPDISFGVPGPADLSDAELQGADLTGTTGLEDVLKHGYLKNIYYDSSTQWPDGFRPPASRAQRG
jgi:uncharacterized protein YjbI with pentapeptide repeats